MNHQALIQSLCDDLTPVRTASAGQLIGRGIATGAAASFAIIALVLGLQPHLASVAATLGLVMKSGSMLAIGLLSVRALRGLARPGAAPVPLLAPVGIVLAMLAAIALGQLSAGADAGAGRLWLGASWQSCSLRIAALSLPLLVGIVWALRQQAPVHLRRAGAVAGLCAGSMAAALYALACSEQSAGFVLLWYSLGIGLAAGIGALLGPRLLRW